MAGREGRGERWAFESLCHELRIVRAGRLEYLERYRLQQEAPAVRSAWAAGDACYFGTIIGSGSHVGPGDGESLHEAMQGIEGVEAAADLLESQLLIARLTASRGVPFHAARAMARELLARGIRIDN